jgi:hypothetical protein
MSTYELDDAQVREALSKGPDSHYAKDLVMEALSEQLPLPVPTKIGAVVRAGISTYQRWAHDNATHSPWIEVGNHEEPYRTDQIGRITEVLSEGVDL